MTTTELWETRLCKTKPFKKKKKKVKMCSEICCKECRFRNCNLLIKLLLHVKHCVLGETGQPQAVAQTKGIHKV